MSNFIITSYYTLDTPYQQVAHDYLMSSVKRLGVPSDIRGVKNLGSWQKNTSFKATFCKLMLEKYPDKNIIFLDADAELLQYPKLFEEIPDDCAVAAHILDRDKWYGTQFPEGQKEEFLSGTLFLRNKLLTRLMVNKWIENCNDTVWEQTVLWNVLKGSGFNIYELPIEYCYMDSRPGGLPPLVKPENEVVVRHNQVSRKLRNIIQ